MWSKTRIVAALVGLLAAGTVACSAEESERPPLSGDQVYALDTPYMDRCKSDANKSPDKQAQLDFLRDRPVVPTQSASQDVWLDYEVQYKGGPGILVRYFAGPKGHPCLFDLIPPANPPEIEAAMIRYVTYNGEPVPPPYGPEVCLSELPPGLTTGSDGVTVATLECHVLVGRTTR